MNSVLIASLALPASSLRTRTALQAEILALRHQLAVLHANAPRRLRLKRSDRLAMGVVVAMVPRMAPMSAYRSTDNSDYLASQSFCLVLEPEITAPAEKTGSNGRERLSP